MRIIGQYEQQVIDRLWQQRTGLPLLLLMESAAMAAANICMDLLAGNYSGDRTILVLAGKGNNGGDAFACARLLAAAGYRVFCREVFPGAELPPEVSANRRALAGFGLETGPCRPEDIDQLAEGSVIVDGIFGTGYRAERPLPEVVRQISGRIRAARGRGVKVLAIDVPSGLDADRGQISADAIQADVTVTFIQNKIGLCAAPGRFIAGRVIVAGIGIPSDWTNQVLEAGLSDGRPDIRLIEASDVRSIRPYRAADSHKGLFGRVLVAGGASGMPGAVLLAAEAAARSGAGLLSVAVPEAIGSLILAARPEGLLLTIRESDSNCPEDTGQNDQAPGKLLAVQTAVAIGMGAGRANWLTAWLPACIAEASGLLLDADALNLIAEQPEYYFQLLDNRRQKKLPPAIITPHPGEFRRLAPEIPLTDRQAAARNLADRCGAIVVLKGAATVVAVPEGPVWINPTGNDGLAKGGSGDVLAGLIAGLLSQGLLAENAAIAGVYLHGLAADLAAGRLGRRSLLAGDVLAAIGEAFAAAGWEHG